jgi:hypothetical protein
MVPAVRRKVRRVFALVIAAAPAAASGPDPDDGLPDDDGGDHTLERPDRGDSLADHDLVTAGIVSSGPAAKTQKNIDPRGRGDRFDAGATTDVWALGNYAYTGTFNSPCGGDSDAGVWVWDVKNANRTKFVGVIESPTGSRANDVKVAGMNSGDILVHSNEACAGGGRGGFEIYNVDDPESPVHLKSVQTDDVNALLRDDFGFTDFGVHNLFLFTQESNDYVGAVVESEFGNFQIFDITDPTSPTLVGFWGAESNSMSDYPAPWPDENYATLTDFVKILDADAYLFSGFGASQNRFLHDITISADGTQAYLANWDAGLILLDISDVTNPVQVSVALDMDNGSLDGEVNSHAVWPSEDGSIVVEGEEDFSAWEGSVAPTNFIFSFDNPIPGVATSTTTGDVFKASQTGNSGTLTATSLSVTSGPLIGSTFSVAEIGDNAMPLGAGSVVGPIVWIGQACNGDGIANPVAGAIAIARRGACTFSEKSINADAAGATAIVIANSLEGTEWSGLRIWDYSDPTNPVLASTFNTTCSASTEPGGTCDAAGTYSVHNVIVETTGNKVKAYISWYSDGMLVLDVSDPENPEEVGRFLDDSSNDDEPNDFWGVYKVPNDPFFYGSDRNGGLYTFKEQGSGSGKK